MYGPGWSVALYSLGLDARRSHFSEFSLPSWGKETILPPTNSNRCGRAPVKTKGLPVWLRLEYELRVTWRQAYYFVVTNITAVMAERWMLFHKGHYCMVLVTQSTRLNVTKCKGMDSGPGQSWLFPADFWPILGYFGLFKTKSWLSPVDISSYRHSLSDSDGQCPLSTAYPAVGWSRYRAVQV